MRYDFLIDTRDPIWHDAETPNSPYHVIYSGVSHFHTGSFSFHQAQFGALTAEQMDDERCRIFAGPAARDFQRQRLRARRIARQRSNQ